MLPAFPSPEVSAMTTTGVPDAGVPDKVSVVILISPPSPIAPTSIVVKMILLSSKIDWAVKFRSPA